MYQVEFEKSHFDLKILDSKSSCLTDFQLHSVTLYVKFLWLEKGTKKMKNTAWNLINLQGGNKGF